VACRVSSVDLYLYENTVYDRETKQASHSREDPMSSLLRSGQLISQVLRNKLGCVGFARNFYTGLMRAEKMKSLTDQAVKARTRAGLMNVTRFNPQGLRYTSR
jgi:hypothetical protein